MIGSTHTIKTFRLTAPETDKEEYSTQATVRGVPVIIQREQLERAAFIDQENAFDVYRMESDRKLDIQEHDKVVDNKNTEYRVHTVLEENADIGFGSWYTCLLVKKK